MGLGLSLFQHRLIILLEVLHQEWREDFPPEKYDFLPEHEEDDRNTRGTSVRRRILLFNIRIQIH